MHCTSLSAAAAALAAALLLPAALLLAAAAAAASLLPLTPYFFVRNDTSAACFAVRGLHFASLILPRICRAASTLLFLHAFRAPAARMTLLPF